MYPFPSTCVDFLIEKLTSGFIIIMEPDFVKRHSRCMYYYLATPRIIYICNASELQLWGGCRTSKAKTTRCNYKFVKSGTIKIITCINILRSPMFTSWTRTVYWFLLWKWCYLWTWHRESLHVKPCPIQWQLPVTAEVCACVCTHALVRLRY